MARASNKGKSKAQDGDLKVVPTARIVSPGEPGYEEIRARQFQGCRRGDTPPCLRAQLERGPGEAESETLSTYADPESFVEGFSRVPVAGS